MPFPAPEGSFGLGLHSKHPPRARGWALTPSHEPKVQLRVPQLQENTGNADWSPDRFLALFDCKFKWPWHCGALSFILKAEKIYSTQKSFRVGWRQPGLGFCCFPSNSQSQGCLWAEIAEGFGVLLFLFQKTLTFFLVFLHIIF